MGNCFSDEDQHQNNNLHKQTNKNKILLPSRRASVSCNNKSKSLQTADTSETLQQQQNKTPEPDTFSFSPLQNDFAVEQLRNCETLEQLHGTLQNFLEQEAATTKNKQIQKSVSLRDVLIDKSLLLVTDVSSFEPTLLFCRFLFWFLSNSEGAKKSCRTNIAVRDTLFHKIFEVVKKAEGDSSPSHNNNSALRNTTINEIIYLAARSIVELTDNSLEGQTFFAESDSLFVSLVKTFQNKATSLDCACYLMNAIDNIIGHRVFSPEGFCRAIAESFIHPDTNAESVHRVAEMTNKNFAFSSEMVIHDALVDALKKQTKSISFSVTANGGGTVTSGAASESSSLGSSHTTTPRQQSSSHASTTLRSMSMCQNSVFVTRKPHAYRQICQAICVFSKYPQTAEKFLCTDAVRDAVIECYRANKQALDNNADHQDHHHHRHHQFLPADISFSVSTCSMTQFDDDGITPPIEDENNIKNLPSSFRQEHCANCALACILSFEKGRKHFQDTKHGSDFVREIDVASSKKMKESFVISNSMSGGDDGGASGPVARVLPIVNVGARQITHNEKYNGILSVESAGSFEATPIRSNKNNKNDNNGKQQAESKSHHPVIFSSAASSTGLDDVTEDANEQQLPYNIDILSFPAALQEQLQQPKSQQQQQRFKTHPYDAAVTGTLEDDDDCSDVDHNEEFAIQVQPSEVIIA